MTTPTQPYPMAVRELRAEAATPHIWDSPPYSRRWAADDRPRCVVGHMDFEVESNAAGTKQGDFITFNQVDSVETWTNDPTPWVGFSKQVVEVTVYSQSRKRAADMTNVIHMKLNGWRGRRTATPPGPDVDPNDEHPPVVQACLLDSVMENFEEDSSFYAVSLFFNVQISAA